MGSDDGNKRSTAPSWLQVPWALDSSSNLLHHHHRRMGIRIWMLRSSLFGCMVVVSFLLLLIRPNHLALWSFLSPEYVLTDTFDRRTQADYDALPSHCQPLAKRFDACQASKAIKKRPTIVFACHRKWCNSFGHCEPCSAFADRWRFLLAQIDALSSSYTRLMMLLLQDPEANEKLRLHHRRVANSKYDDTCHVHVKMDAPVAGMLPLASTLYQDPSSWLGELFHFRSYRVRDRQPLLYTDVLSSSKRTHTYFTHFTPSDYGINVNYNACYFHILYQPDAALREEIHRHWEWMRNPVSSSSAMAPPFSTSVTTIEREFGSTTIANATQPIHIIGIYYSQFEDDASMEKEQVMREWQQLHQCARSSFERRHESVRFFLATENAFLKQYVRQEEPSVYVTGETVEAHVRRGNRGDDDRQMWLDLYLLSQCDGIVTNAVALAAADNTTNVRVHPFPVLAKKIGFLSNTEFHQCVL
jgi:hypothetical protein